MKKSSPQLRLFYLLRIDGHRSERMRLSVQQHVRVRSKAGADTARKLMVMMGRPVEKRVSTVP
jgi:hypothetical protein